MDPAGSLGGAGSLDLLGIQGFLEPTVSDLNLLLVFVWAVQQVGALTTNVEEFGIPYYGINDPRQGKFDL